jgi:EmrB/QacA subfamily drug resistance transporter
VTATATRPARAGIVTQYGMLAGPLLSMMDSSIVNVAVVPISRGLHTSLSTAQWAVSGYMLALGTGLAGTAWLARRFGTIPVYRASLIAFTVASAACAFAPDADGLVAARILQGLVAAPLVPLAMSMLLGTGGEAKSIPAIAGILLFAGPALGPAVGGALIGAAGWRTIFAVNLPLGALAAVAAWRLPDGDGVRRYGEKFDVTGLVMLAGGLGVLLYGVTEHAWLVAVAGAALLAGYGWHAARTSSPALDLSLARRPVAALSMGLCAMASVVTWAAVFLLPVFAQQVQGHSALAAGVAMAPQGIVTGLSTALLRNVKLPVRLTVVCGFAVLAAASLGILAIGVRTPLWVIAVILAVRSVSIGAVVNPLLTALTDRVDPGRMADASTLFNVAQRIAGSFGIGLLAALYTDLALSSGSVRALHVTGLVIAGIAACGGLAAGFLPGHSTARATSA